MHFSLSLARLKLIISIFVIHLYLDPSCFFKRSSVSIGGNHFRNSAKVNQ